MKCFGSGSKEIHQHIVVGGVTVIRFFNFFLFHLPRMQPYCTGDSKMSREEDFTTDTEKSDYSELDESEDEVVIERHIRSGKV